MNSNKGGQLEQELAVVEVVMSVNVVVVMVKVVVEEETTGIPVGSQDRSETDPNRPNKKAKPKYGRTQLRFTEYGSNGEMKRTPDGLDTDETRLYWTLVEWRTKLAKRSGLDSWMILANHTLYGLVEASRDDTFFLLRHLGRQACPALPLPGASATRRVRSTSTICPTSS